MSAGADRYPDTILGNAMVLTMDEASPRAEAVATQGDRIVAVGSWADLRATAGPATRIVDLAGKTLTPGFIEPHNHFTVAGVIALLQADLTSPPVGRVECMADLIAALRDKAATTPPGQWVQGFGYDDTLLAEKRHPTRADLDRASTEHPIWIYHVSGHLGVANSRALTLAGIGRDTPPPTGGAIRMAPHTGDPDGVFAEAPAMNQVSARIPGVTLAEQVRGIEYAAGRLLAAGVTTAVDATGESARAFEAVAIARARGLLPVRASLMVRRNLVYGERGDARTYMTGRGDARVKIGAFKITHDGSIQGYTGWLAAPYHTPFRGDAAYCGFPVIPPDQLRPLVLAAHQAGFQIAVHANGDAAIDGVIDAIRRAQAESPRPDARHRIEHCQMARDDQLDAMAALGITPSFFVAHTYYWGDRHRDIFMGPARGRRISPLAAARARGLRFSLHSDWPVTPVSPLFSIWAAVNRLTRNGDVLGPEFRITPGEALRAMTIDAAWQDFAERDRGSLAVGKLADFTVLAENPLTVAPERIKDIAVDEVIVGGETMFMRGADGRERAVQAASGDGSQLSG